MRPIHLAILMLGCAEGRVITPTVDQVQITMHPWEKPVRLVGRQPPRNSYAFVGRVRAAIRDQEFVEAARRANETLRQKARTLGADVIKIEIVSSGRQVVLAGRAYRSLN